MTTLAVLSVVALAATWTSSPEHADRTLNRVRGGSPKVGESARRLHARLTVVDLHVDSLLWGRDLTRRHNFGQVDLPRLAEGNVGLVVFAAVTRMPAGAARGSNGVDRIRQLAQAQGWPSATRASYCERALFLARRLEETAAASGGRLVLVRTRADLDALLERRVREPHLIGGLLAIEGAQALDSDPARLDRLFAAGFRLLSLTHFADNEWGGSSQGRRRGGLTSRGRDLVRRMEAQGWTLDLAHASPRTISDVTALVHRPVIVSHTGVRATCDSPRNLSDAEIAAVARTRGVVGIGLWAMATCGEDLGATVRSIRHVIEVAGIDHVALGSDFDGAVVTPIDAAGLPALTQALTGSGLSDEAVAKILGGNALRVLRETLP